MDLRAYTALRPFLYHTTAAKHNVPNIKIERALHSTQVLLQRHTLQKRSEPTEISRNGRITTIGDQGPLNWKNVEFTGGWCFQDMLQALNERVFFWAGTHRGPVRYGVNFMKAKAHGGEETTLRVSFDAFCARNANLAPYFCKFNSGAPRWSGGRKSPRGPDTFLTAEKWSVRPSKVAEVSFIGSVWLPDDTQILRGGNRWQSLW